MCYALKKLFGACFMYSQWEERRQYRLGGQRSSVFFKLGASWIGVMWRHPECYKLTLNDYKYVYMPRGSDNFSRINYCFKVHFFNCICLCSAPLVSMWVSLTVFGYFKQLNIVLLSFFSIFFKTVGVSGFHCYLTYIFQCFSQTHTSWRPWEMSAVAIKSRVSPPPPHLCLRENWLRCTCPL